MKKQLELAKELHEAMEIPILPAPAIPSEDRIRLRHAIIAEEVDEYLEGALMGDTENVAKELGDILMAVYGTILEHGLQDKMEDVFEEIHRSNMTKDANGGQKMIKGASYEQADLSKIFKD